jgi:hypothetical protein
MRSRFAPGNRANSENLATLPIAVLVVQAVSNRMEDLVPIVPAILNELSHIPPRSLRRVGAQQAGQPDARVPSARCTRPGRARRLPATFGGTSGQRRGGAGFKNESRNWKSRGRSGDRRR